MFLIPVVAVLIIAESIILLTNNSTPVETDSKSTGLVPQSEQVVKKSISLNWDVVTTEVKTGTVGEASLFVTSDKDIFVDALDLYVKYDPLMVSVTEATSKGFVTPSFKKVSAEKGLVVMNFLVSEATGFKFNKGQKVEIAKLKLNYVQEGTVELSLAEGTLVVENASAKVLPFNSDKLVINVVR